MNVYNRATGWGTFIALAWLAATIVVDVWLMAKLPMLQHGLGYALLQIGMVVLFLKVLWMIFRGGSRSAKD